MYVKATYYFDLLVTGLPLCSNNELIIIIMSYLIVRQTNTKGAFTCCIHDKESMLQYVRTCSYKNHLKRRFFLCC